MFPLEQQVIVLTGASSGIGVAIADTLYAAGADLCIGSRRLHKLQQVATSIQVQHPTSPGHVMYQECNVIHREQVQALVDAAEANFNKPVDVLINCAGVMYCTNMANGKQDQWEEMVDVNCKGVLHGFGAVISKMVARGKGKIVTISSDAGIRPFQTLAVYCASKVFVETLSEITRRELIGTGVTLCTICPGDVRGTELILKNTDQEAAKKLGMTIGTLYGEGNTREQMLDPADVAQSVLYALTAPSHVAINTIVIEPRDQY